MDVQTNDAQIIPVPSVVLHHKYDCSSVPTQDSIDPHYLHWQCLPDLRVHHSKNTNLILLYLFGNWFLSAQGASQTYTYRDEDEGRYASPRYAVKRVGSFYLFT